MITGVHTMFCSSQVEELRAFIRDKLGFPFSDVGDGWLLFDLPEADMGCHPADDAEGKSSGTHYISFYCDDIEQTVAELTGRGVIKVSGGAIAEIGTIAPQSAGEVIDATGLHVLPGVIDSQVHFREPGAEHKETLSDGSRSAVMGGVTAVFEMPNTNPLTTSAEALAGKVARGRAGMFCDFAFYVGATRENVDELGELERLSGSAGVKVFMGKILDGFSEHMADQPAHRTFLKSDAKQPEFEDVVKILKDSGCWAAAKAMPPA